MPAIPQRIIILKGSIFLMYTARNTTAAMINPGEVDIASASRLGPSA